MESVVKQSGQSAGSAGSQPPPCSQIVRNCVGIYREFKKRYQLTVSCVRKVIVASFLI